MSLSASFWQLVQLIEKKKKKNVIKKHLQKQNYNETGKKSTGKLLELCVRVKQKLANVRKRLKLQRLIHRLAPSERGRLQSRKFWIRGKIKLK